MNYKLRLTLCKVFVGMYGACFEMGKCFQRVAQYWMSYGGFKNPKREE